MLFESRIEIVIPKGYHRIFNGTVREHDLLLSTLPLEDIPDMKTPWDIHAYWSTGEGVDEVRINKRMFVVRKIK